MHATAPERSWIEISLDHYRHNIRELRHFMPGNSRFMQIVKADAYGHGAVEIAHAAVREGAVMLGVANSDEGRLLRLQGIEIPVLILSPSLTEEIPDILKYDLTPTVCTTHFAAVLSRVAREKGVTVAVHVNIDTGMGRSGIPYHRALSVINELKTRPGLRLEGIFSHYAASESDPDYSRYQLDRFRKILRNLDTPPRWIHIANSAGVVNCPDNVGNLVRVGLLSYGVYTDNSLCDKIDLKPVMTFKSRVSYVSRLKKGDSVGYNRTYTARRDTPYAVIPVGYADGYDYLLSNKGKMLIRQVVCPVIGKVSMDMTTVDISAVQEVRTGDEVVVFGDEHPEIRVETLCRSYGGSAYELLCQTGRRARRFYLQKGEIVRTAHLARREFVSADYNPRELSRVIEAAIGEKTGNREIARLIFNTVLERLFREESRPLFHRHGFDHRLIFSEPKNKVLAKNYFQIDTELSFTKPLLREYFLITCANNEEELERYFRREDVEYRWILDGALRPDEKSFKITAVKVDDLDLTVENRRSHDCLEVTCSHPELKKRVGEPARFLIKTRTYYPKSSHQLTVYVTGLTKGAEISLDYDDVLPGVEVVPFFSGGQPEIYRSKGMIRVLTPDDQWLLPGSGVVFAY